jgi:glycosyltransferase involved in cell wall biosynthesis
VTSREPAPRARALFVTDHTPALGSGRALRVYSVVRALAALGPVDVAYTRFGADAPDDAFRAIDGVTYHEVVASRGASRLVAYGRARLGGVPATVARGVSPELAHEAYVLAGAADRGLVIADGPIVASATARLARLRPVVYCAHNLESAFRHTLGVAGVPGRDALERFERRLIRRADESWQASPADVEGARRLAPGARIRYVPNVVDVKAITPVDTPGDRRAILVADYSYPPNQRGLEFLIEEVFPRVWERLPEARLAVVGRGLSLVGDIDPRVERLGFVDDLATAYARADAALVPLLEGGGSPLKFVEALAYGLPVIATPRGAAGMEGTAGEHYRVADGAGAFADAVVQVLAEGAPALAAAGRALAEEAYSIESLVRRIAPASARAARGRYSES